LNPKSQIPNYILTLSPSFNSLSSTIRILIIGGARLIGQLVVGQLLSDASHTIILTEVVSPPIPAGVKYPESAKPVKVDLVTNASTVIAKTIDTVFIFQRIMFSGAETNFDLGMAVNVNATRNLLEVPRK
jgi:nucleoside-diphosphate-sugar epimerase